MKKLTNRIISFVFLMFMGVLLSGIKAYAASNITEIAARGTTQGATVEGTADSDVAAVLIEILDANNEIVTLETHPVTDGRYFATLSCTLSEGSTYTAYVVNYNGNGETQRTTFTIPVSVTSVSLNKTSETITTAGGTLQLTATVYPANASDRRVSWSTNNASVVTVDTTGKVTAKGNGTATITVTTADGGKTATATITVAISNPGGSGNAGGNQGGSGNNSGSQDSDDDDSSAAAQGSAADSNQKTEKVSVPVEYTVVKGDTLGKIARRNNMTLFQLLALNPQIKNPNFIRVGQKIVVGYNEKTVTTKVTDKSTGNSTVTSTNSVYYTVQRGDSLYKIAKMNKMALNRLISLNPDVMTRKYIYPGQKIRVK